MQLAIKIRKMSCHILHLCSFFQEDVVTNFANSLRSFHLLLAFKVASVSSMMHYMYHWIGFGNFQGCTDRKLLQSKGKSVHNRKKLGNHYKKSLFSHYRTFYVYFPINDVWIFAPKMDFSKEEKWTCLWAGYSSCQRQGQEIGLLFWELSSHIQDHFRASPEEKEENITDLIDLVS